MYYNYLFIQNTFISFFYNVHKHALDNNHAQSTAEVYIRACLPKNCLIVKKSHDYEYVS